MKLAGYMIRAPRLLAKMAYDRASGTVIYRAKLQTSSPRGPRHPGRGASARSTKPIRSSVQTVLQATRRKPKMLWMSCPGSAESAERLSFQPDARKRED